MPLPPVDLAFTKALPKCELHAHLTGSISKECLHEIWVRKQRLGLCLGLDDPLAAINPGHGFVDIKTFFPVFDEYIYTLCNDVESVRFATNSVLQDFCRDGVRYLELRTTPRACDDGNMSQEQYVATVCDVLQTWNQQHRNTMKAFLILSIDRRMTAIQADAVVDLAIHHKFSCWRDQEEPIVVAVDLCGNPARGNASTFTAAFQKAKSHDLGIVVHFAELRETSSEAELRTILDWEPNRLGHAIHVPESIKEVIEERRLPLEICLTCNVLSRLTRGGYLEHHFGRWLKSPCPIALGTDDIGIFGSPLSQEYFLAAQHFDLDAEDIIDLSRQAIRSSFAGEGSMKKVIDEFEQRFALQSSKSSQSSQKRVI